MKNILRIGTSGDYPPFSFYNTETANFEGMDIDAARSLCKALKSELIFVKFNWENLTNDLINGKFDIAMGGITHNVERKEIVANSSAYITTGTCPLVRTADCEKYQDLKDIDNENVRIILNQGGSNDIYFSQRIKSASIIRHDVNHEIAAMVKDGTADIWITDNIETLYWQSKIDGLTAVNPANTFTIDNKVYLTRKDEHVLQKDINTWIGDMKNERETEKLQLKWLGQILY